MTVGVAELKARLSRHLKRGQAGREILVTHRGQPVAKIVPIVPAERRDSRRERLVRAGLLIPGSGRVRRTLRAPTGDPAKGRAVLDALLQECREGSEIRPESL